jgi:septal ring factor EnvC (AmiA/AmiB activator)
MKYVTYSLFLLAVYSSALGASELDDIKSTQAQLEQMLEKLQQTEQERKNQSQALKRLEKQLNCNWQLIQSYESCESRYSMDPEAYLACSTRAKAAARQCLEN